MVVVSVDVKVEIWLMFWGGGGYYCFLNCSNKLMKYVKVSYRVLDFKVYDVFKSVKG